VIAALGHADHVVDLDLAAGPHTGPAGDAGIEIDGNGGIGDVEFRRHVVGEEFRAVAIAGNPHRAGPLPEHRLLIRTVGHRPHIAGEKLEHHLARFPGPFGIRLHHHPGGRFADAGRGEHPFALDIDHAGAAVAVWPIAGHVDMA
jgi:hypothetical protein